jgi:hypothetical protein
MLKRDITYEDFDGNEVTDTYYFNLTRTELIELEAGYEGGLELALRRIIETKDRKQLISEFQRIILAAYGVRSEDGKRFIKNDQVREEFKQTPAFDALFMDLATSDDSASIFIKGVVPKDFAKQIEKSEVVPINPTGVLPTAKE